LLSKTNIYPQDSIGQATNERQEKIVN